MADSVFQIGAEGIRTDALMQEIMKQAAARSKTEYECLPDGQIRRRMGEVQHSINIDRRWDIIRDTQVRSHRRMSGKIIVFFKNKTKKLFKWYVDSLFDQQVEFNHTVWSAYYQLENEIKELRNEIEQLKAENKKRKDG